MTREKLFNWIERWGPWAYGFMLLAAAFLSHFAVLSNDSFPLRWQAAHLSIRHPSTFYDAFFPIGYPALLRLADYLGSPFTVLEIVQILLGILFFRNVTRFARVYLGVEGALIALPFLVFSPPILRAELSAVPDFLSALLALLAFVALLRTEDSPRDLILAGVFLGIGQLFRTHILALALALVVAMVVLQPRESLRKIAFLASGLAPFVLLQGFIQLWSGHGFFETGQAFNLWKTMHGVDWSNPPAIFDITISQIIVGEPRLFAEMYVMRALYQMYVLVPLTVYLVWGLLRRDRASVPMILALASIIFVLVTLPGGSARASVPVLPVVIVAVISLFQWISFGQSASKSRKVLTIALPIGLTVLAVMAVFWGSLRARARVESYQRLQSTFGLTQRTAALGIYTDDYALYFPDLDDATPRHSGGWEEIGLPQYLRENPHVPDSTSIMWYDHLQTLGVGFVAIRIPPLDERVAQFASVDTNHFFRIRFVGPYNVYRVR